MMHDVDMLRRLWSDHSLTKNDIRRQMRIGSRTIDKLAEKYGLPKRQRLRRQGQFEEIEVDEIYRRAAAIRATWTDERRMMEVP